MKGTTTRVIGWTNFCSDAHEDYCLKEDLDYKAAQQELDDVVDAIIKALRDGLYHWDGFTHQAADFGAPVLDDNRKVTFSYREWGSIMAQAYPDEIDDSDHMGYCEWAWSTRKENEHLVKIPPESEWLL